MIEKIEQMIRIHNLIDKGDHIVAGVSGGPDSVCLLHILAGLRDKLGITLHGVHVNHMIRGDAADEDQQYTEEFCRSLGVPCEVFRYDIPAIAKAKGLSSEEAGREARYEAFNQVLDRVGGGKIAVAQNLNDQAETILLRLIRGTGTDGLAGIEPIRDGVVIRPLLEVTRDEIENYCREHGLHPRIDLTNLEPIYARNRIRLELLPLLREHYNANIVQGLGRLARIAREDRDFIRETVDRVILEHGTFDTGPDQAAIWRQAPAPIGAGGDQTPGRAFIPAAVIAGQHPAVAKRIIAAMFSAIGLVQDIGAVHLESALALVKEGVTSSSADFPGGYYLRVSYGTVEFRNRFAEQNQKTGLEPSEPGTLKSTVLAADELSALPDTEFVKYFDYDSILASNAEIVLRTRRSGDRIAPLGMSGSKKIKDFFIDEKIPQEERDRIPLVCAGSDIIWIVGSRISEKYKVSDTTKRILILEYQGPVC